MSDGKVQLGREDDASSRLEPCPMAVSGCPGLAVTTGPDGAVAFACGRPIFEGHCRRLALKRLTRGPRGAP